MKQLPLILFLALFTLNLSLFAGDIKLQFQPHFPNDSIRIENLDNQTTHTLVGVNELNVHEFLIKRAV